MTPARLAPAEISSFWTKFCVGMGWDMKILLCLIEQKTQKNLAQLRIILSKKAKLSNKKNGGRIPTEINTLRRSLLSRAVQV